MGKGLAVLAVLALALQGCASFSCAGWERLDYSRRDTPETREQARKHNLYGEAQGCWRAPR